jgi:hypothetical protein
MKHDDIIRMGREAGLIKDWMVLRNEESDALARYTALVAAAEREACAVAAWSAGMDVHNNAAGLPCDARETGAQCAAAIRARGKNE